MSAFDILEGLTSREEIRKSINDHIFNSVNSREVNLLLTDIISGIYIKLFDIKNKCNELNEEMQLLAELREVRTHIGWNDMININIEVPERAEHKAHDLWNCANGFYHLEWTSTEIPYRWTGPSTDFHFTSVIRRDQRSIARLIIVHGGDRQKIYGTTCYVDGQPSRAICRDNADYSEIITVIEPQVNRRTITIKYEVPSVSSAGPNDDRMIGLPISALIIEPATNEEINKIMNIKPYKI